MKKKIKKEVVLKKEYYDTKNYRIVMDIITVLVFILSIVGTRYSILVRGDTAELAKFSDKPIYYDIKLLVEDDMSEKAVISDKYLGLNLKLIIDDFKIERKGFLDVNYNAVFTKIKYFMVYDYNLGKNDFKYMMYTLDDKVQAQITYDDLYSAPTQMNYSLTPNKKYCYILIYTETMSRKNLDLVFFKYYDKGDTFTLDTVSSDGQVKIDLV